MDLRGTQLEAGRSVGRLFCVYGQMDEDLNLAGVGKVERMAQILRVFFKSTQLTGIKAWWPLGRGGWILRSGLMIGVWKCQQLRLEVMEKILLWDEMMSLLSVLSRLSR